MDLFEKKCRYIVPHYQRPYVWKREEQWEPLWDDIRNLAERVFRKEDVRPHFLGAIVLEQASTATGEIESRFLIDGQQRLTTIQLLLEAFHDLCKKLPGSERYGEALEDLTRNDYKLSKVDDEKYKVWPTNVDREHFRRVMQVAEPSELFSAYQVKPRAKETGHPLADAYLYFFSAIDDWLSDGDGDQAGRVSALFGAIRDLVRLVVIDLSKGDDAQMIFETLNARGTPLLPSDLVKNFLFHRAQLQGEAADPLYEQFWQKFDEDGKYWRAEIGRGRVKRARIDIFLQLYLSLQEREDVPVGHLYQRFREFAEAEHGGMAREHLLLLTEYGRVFRSFEETPSDCRAGLFFPRLSIMETMTAHPYLLEVFRRRSPESREVDGVLEVIESFLVRRMVCTMTTKGYNRLFIEMLRTLDGEPATLPGRVAQFLRSQEAESLRWPGDVEFRRAWLSNPLYDRLRGERLAMILRALEQAMYDPKSEVVVSKSALTIEHLLPRGWKDEQWPLPAGSDPAEARAERMQVMHSIGNLTLLTNRLNPSISNSAWSTKRLEISKHSLLKLNHEIAEEPDWDEAAIRRRGERLFGLALKIWPGPGE
jgi:hypothetical protein